MTVGKRRIWHSNVSCRLVYSLCFVYKVKTRRRIRDEGFGISVGLSMRFYVPSLRFPTIVL